jgi:hypothetical protein
MPKFTFTSPEGKSFTVEGPDGATPEQAFSVLQSQLAAAGAPAPAPVASAAPTDRQKLLSSAPMRLAKGMADPIEGAAQLASRMPGADYVNKAADAVGGFLNRQVFNRVGLPGDFAGEVLGIRGATPQQLDSEVANAEREYQAARQATAPTTLSSLVTGQKDPGTDWMRTIGNVISPANAAIARVLPGAGTTIPARAATGAAGGTLAALAQPVVTDGSGSDFAAKKAAQVGLGAVTGGIAAPVLGAITDRAAQWFANMAASRSAARPPNATDVEQIARTVANDTGQRWEDLGPQMQAQMRTQVAQSLQAAGGRQDPAALARLRDFQAEGMQPTLGQITRDPRQFANEMNLRQLPDTGDPLLQRMQQQGVQLQDKLGTYGQGAAQDYRAGNELMAPLRAYDQKLSTDVRAAYQAARASAGKDQELPLQGLAQDAADVLDNYGDKVPSGVVNQLRKYGILPGQEGNSAPRKLFTVEEADKLLKVINSSGSATDDATNAALSQLRGAVKNAVTQPGADDVFAPARKLAAQRFALHDSVDALADVAKGRASPDTFVNRYLINADTDQTKQLAGILRDQSPDAFQQARAQIGAKLGRAAFGENVAGDKAFSVERYAKALNDLGDDKLAAFFSPQEVEQLHRLGRVAAYINQAPNKAPVNTSGNWAALMNIAGRIPGLGPAMGVLRAGAQNFEQGRGVQRALAAEVPVQPAQVDPAAVRRLSDLLTAGGVTTGAVTAGAVK